jgi:hypothetical protein
VETTLNSQVVTVKFMVMEDGKKQVVVGGVTCFIIKYAKRVVDHGWLDAKW